MMIRNCRPLLSKLSRPISDVLKGVPSGSQFSELLAKQKITTARQWQELGVAGVNKLVAEGLPQSVANAVSANIEEESQKDVRQALIMYGSQMGTAEGYARMLAMMSASHAYTPIVCTMDEGAEMLKQGKVHPSKIVLITSTYGIGEFPNNAQQFYKSLCAGELTDAMKDVPYAVLGLGNSGNEYFCFAAKNLDAKLKSIGGQSIMRMQLSCELQENGHETVFRGWKRALWSAISVGEEHGEAKLLSVYNCTPSTEQPVPVLERTGFGNGEVVSNALVSPAGYNPPHHLITFAVPVAVQKKALKGRTFTIMDNIDVMPVSEPAIVERALKRLKLKADDVVHVEPLPGAAPSVVDGKTLTVKQILQQVIDLNAIPTRSLLETFSEASSKAVEQSYFSNLANDLSPANEYSRRASGVWTVMDALEESTAEDIGIQHLLTHCPWLQARSYSIARKVSDTEFEVFYKTPEREGDNKKHIGVCTKMMDKLAFGDKVLVSGTASGVQMAPIKENAVYVALGTGIGGIRAQLFERLEAKEKGKKVGKARLYYGFRQAGKDQCFVDELDKFEKAGVLEKVTYVSSHDTTFRTPMDEVGEEDVKLIGDKGHVAYCGLGGTVPSLFEGALQRAGFDVALLRSSGRLHEEYFTPDFDTENLLRDLKLDQSAMTLSQRYRGTDMFCFQCEQTFQNKGCHKVGVCGKTPTVAALQDLTVQAVKVLGYYCFKLRELGVPVPVEANRFTLFALFSTLTNVNFDEKRFQDIIARVHKLTAEVKALYEGSCKTPEHPNTTTLPETLPDLEGLVALGRNVGVLTKFANPDAQSAAGVSEMLVYGLKGIAAYTDHSLMNQKEDEKIYEFLHKCCAFLLSPEQYDLGKGVELCLEAGEINVASMGLLYDSNKTLGVPEPTAVPMTPQPGKCILVSGHDLIILRELLKETDEAGIDVYTHGEMLPAHSYPDLKAHKSLRGHYGGAWMRQSIEFPHFPGPVLMTTNCLTEPHESYKNILFTAGAVGWSGVKHLGDSMEAIKFDQVIAAALAAPGFQEGETEFTYVDPPGVNRPKELTVGFGHETVISVAPTIVEEINKGNITRFFVVGGCDGYEGHRSYYTDLVAALPPTTVILTVGCGKFRINHLDLGTIGDTGIPRLLDMGQCNDSFSAIQVAVALAGVLKCDVTDLPLSICLSWFEQKAIAVLLSCLHLGLKPIHVGPTLPAFITPDVLNVLVENFGVRVCKDGKQDAIDLCKEARMA